MRIDLLIRGICCLRAGLPGVSETIRVTSIVDRFLEHSRVFYFENAGAAEVFLASADWMPRNFFRRIEVMFPIEDLRLKARIVENILPTMFADTVKARVQQVDGTYVRRSPEPGEVGLRSQVALQGLARESAREVGETGRRLFVPIMREPGRNGSDGKQMKKRVARRGPRGPGRHGPRKKAIDEA